MIKTKQLAFCVALVSFSAPQLALAENFHADGTIGGFILSKQGYTSSIALDASAAYQQSNFIFRVGGIHFGEIELKDREDEDEDDTEINMSAAYLGAGYQFDFKVIFLELEAGAAFTRTEARYQGRDVAENDDVSPYANIRLVKKINNLVSLQGGWKHISDVSGTDIDILQTGVRFSF